MLFGRGKLTFRCKDLPLRRLVLGNGEKEQGRRHRKAGRLLYAGEDLRLEGQARWPFTPATCVEGMMKAASLLFPEKAQSFFVSFKWVKVRPLGFLVTLHPFV